MFEGLLGQVKEGLQKWGDSFTDTKGIFQGGRDARAFGRLRDFAEGQSFQTPGTAAGGYQADTPWSLNPHRDKRLALLGGGGQSPQGPWQHPLQSLSEGTISYPEADPRWGVFQSRGYTPEPIGREQAYDEGMELSQQNRLRDFHRAIESGEDPTESEKRAYYFDKYDTYEPNFISKFLASRLWD